MPQENHQDPVTVIVNAEPYPVAIETPRAAWFPLLSCGVLAALAAGIWFYQPVRPSGDGKRALPPAATHQLPTVPPPPLIKMLPGPPVPAPGTRLPTPTPAPRIQPPTTGNQPAPDDIEERLNRLLRRNGSR